jgi:CheY-like chemotaxis protein/anti-sigma regulatory factor (Ser/Thr protein kinase)
MALRVLLVDDITDVRRLVRTALGIRGGFTVVGEASDGAEAIALSRREQPDIVVLDIGLPDIAGQDVLSQIRRANPAAKVVVFSATDPVDSADIASQVEGYARKDDHIDYLLDLLESLGTEQTDQATLHLRADVTSARQARAFTRETLADWRADTLGDDALLVVTELVTNAVTHARSECELRLSISANSLRIEVMDEGSGTPDPLPPSATRNHGRGLHLIDAIAAAWGVEPSAPAGKLVWAEI